MTTSITTYNQPAISIAMPVVPSLATIQSVEALAKLAARSGLTKAKTPEQAFFIAMYGLELGIPPMTALRTIYSVEKGGRMGPPTCSGEALLALMRRSGKVIVTIPDPSTVIDSATVHVKRMDTGEEGSFTFTMEMAKKASLIRSGSAWETYPHMMMIWRAVSMASKVMCSDITGGLYTVEEIYTDTQVDEAGEPIGDIVEGSGSRAVKPWATADSVEYLYNHALKTIKDLSKSEFTRLAGIPAFDDYAAWNEKYAMGRDAWAVIEKNFNEEMAAQPPAAPKGTTPAAIIEDDAPALDNDPFAEDADLLEAVQS